MKAQLIVTAHTEDTQRDVCLVLKEGVHFEVDALNVLCVGTDWEDGFCLFDGAVEAIERFFDEAGCTHDDGSPCGSANREALDSWVKELGHPDGYAAPMGHRGDEWGFIFIPGGN